MTNRSELAAATERTETKATSNYDKYPAIPVEATGENCWAGWEHVCAQLQKHIAEKRERQPNVVLVVDCYQGVYLESLEKILRDALTYDAFVVTREAFKQEDDIRRMVQPDLTDDRVFGKLTAREIQDYFIPKAARTLNDQVASGHGVTVVVGAGAAAVVGRGDILVYADMARWEIQLRMRRHEVNNLGVHNQQATFSQQYKQGFFIDWRVLDRHKQTLMDSWNYVLDTNKHDAPKLVRGTSVMSGLKLASNRPFRVVPFFDPGPWGGQWMKEVCDLDKSAANFAWCFDCVPEENSLLLQFGQHVVEIPSINLVFAYPQALLGQHVFQRFGKEFPIRFDFLDTIEGGNLSLQVHPTKEYIKEHFGLDYTQDESYYMLDAREDAVVYLGLKNDIDPSEMIGKLREAQQTSKFDADKYVNKFAVRKHDHVLIPAGTIHCSGRNSMVLEISATPYIFTFKLWDWDRLGLDGKPRPIHIDHGEKVIQWDRQTEWTKKNLVNAVEKIAEGDGWTEERTGLHASQFIETRRHWFTGTVPHHTGNTVNVLNLIEGREAIVESPSQAFEPFVVHYAETFIIPAAVGDYTIRPHGESAGQQCATIKAFVRKETTA
ncbi:class I mannose-6-phosphate isomerase [Dawidia soli]|uniref:Class I mannose-6-phosphate isomerase n=1 Tax=Dawidia soli TaxID=2782352 RepID=A0AAP2DAS8_9BACT|nr:class I mannose-6-phosphate isomerase [Dawidia soli]MBT1685872.1 class I mannose-6-phosphate isomerase [Dawidia soli]